MNLPWLHSNVEEKEVFFRRYEETNVLCCLVQNLRRVLNAVFAIRYHDPSKVSLFDKKKTRLGSGFLLTLRTKIFCHMVALVAICVSWLVTSKGVLFAARLRNELSFAQARCSSFEKKKTRLEIQSAYCVINTQGSFRRMAKHDDMN
mmetsp:Transcript_27690/g.50144  ORF Transcript_27690/g.50144 Transcript_27690/m.50144 type:complete len:147 (-) Transcript_27690:691-1131(-)